MTSEHYQHALDLDRYRRTETKKDHGEMVPLCGRLASSKIADMTEGVTCPKCIEKLKRLGVEIN